MQHPVGYTIRNGRAEMTDFWALLLNKFSILQIFHVLPAAMVLSAFFVMGISAWHLLRKQNIEFFTRSFRTGLAFGLVFSIAVAVEGDLHGTHVAEVQPAKLAAMEAHWETQSSAPIILVAWPDQEAGKNLFEFGSIPGILSFLGYHDFNATVRGLNDFPRDERPPVFLTFLGFRTMVGLGTLFILLTVVGWFKRKHLLDSPGYLKIMLWSIPLPYIAIQAGWVLAEVGRQPWIVYGLMRTSEAASPTVAGYQVLISLIAFIGVYGLLGAVGYYLIFKHARKGPVLEKI
jgi:cytochrome d ubiquinol oxidase subunit I